MSETEKSVRLESAKDNSVEAIHEYHIGDWEAGPQELRVEARAILDWCDYKMGEGAGRQQAVKKDPWGVPVDTRGM